ncbi:NEDD8-specific protease [Verticillium alfalfae VaMs.102]|uniref:NEDD8-specific protease n=1 Tax=Verticillium alfalfae (strain VaMs.102 / ATCC MYA-4576 / FGSC 10136) TaxID=526221 RepID=C9SJ28_VERA1|nr:NEDD8-specific protease [Verticillium alfalfae VaMs.102]EEY18951.1 NEDD8-specific protease [Verticillium alfalfae VaMs.102]
MLESQGRPTTPSGSRLRDFADLALRPSRRSHSRSRHSSTSSGESLTAAPVHSSSPKPESRLAMPFRKMARHFGDSLSPHSTVLSYHDITQHCFLGRVRHIATARLYPPSDRDRYLERELLPKYPQARIILLRPSMTFLLMKEPDMRAIRSALPDFSKVTHIFLPINDARNVAQAEGGSHWSLLLVSAIDGVAFHYDSLGGANYQEARLATRKMSEILNRPLRFLNLEDCPQQENGSDCGVFVCILMRHLLVKRLLSANAREKVSMSMGNKMIDSHGGRKEMLKIIESFRKEGERRRSRSASPYSSKTPPRIE